MRRAIVGLVALKIAGIILVFDPAGADAFPLAKSILSRGTAWILAALIGMALFRYGTGIVPRASVHRFVVIFVVANLISALTAENAYIAVFGEREKYLGLTFLADMVVLYVAVAIGFRNRSDWALLATAIALAGLATVTYAAVQSLGLDPFRWTEAHGRPFGTLAHPDMFGHFLSIVFGGALGIAIVWRTTPFPRVAAGCAIALALFAAVISATRGSLLGFAAALALAPLVSLTEDRMRTATIGPFVLRGLVIISVLMTTVALSPVAERLRTTAQGEQVRDRVLIYETAIRAVVDRPISGYGPDNFGVAYPRYRQPDSTVMLGVGPATSAHSWPLQAAATLGLVGLAALLALLIVAMRSLARGVRSSPTVAVPILLATVAYLAHGLVSVDSISTDWWLWVGLGSAATLERERAFEVRSARRLHWLAAGGLICLAAAVSLTGSAALRSNRDAQLARLAWQEGRPSVSLAAAVSAVRGDPGRAENWNWLGLALDLDKSWASAADAYAEAAARSPHEATYWANLARSRARQALAGDEAGGGSAAALAAARRAVAADPNSPEPNVVLGEVANRFGEHELALGAAATAIRLYRLEPSYDLIASEAALSTADRSAARRGLDEILTVRDSAVLRIAAARLALDVNDLEAARRHALRALQLDPQNRAARGILGEAGG